MSELIDQYGDPIGEAAAALKALEEKWASLIAKRYFVEYVQAESAFDRFLGSPILDSLGERYPSRDSANGGEKIRIPMRYEE